MNEHAQIDNRGCAEQLRHAAHEWRCLLGAYDTLHFGGRSGSLFWSAGDPNLMTQLAIALLMLGAASSATTREGTLTE